MRRYTVNDATAPALAEVLIDNEDKSALIYMDEIASLLIQLSQKDGQQLRGMMLQGWKGVEPYVLDRIGRGVRYVDSFSISVLGTIQPDRLDSILLSSHGGTTSGDGLLQRFGMMVYPDQVQKYNYIDRPWNPSAYDVAQKVFKRIGNLNVQPLPSNLRIHNEWNVPILRFDDEAQERFADWVVKHQEFMRLSKLPPVLESHYTKYNKLIVTIAALLHIADYPNTGAIALDTLERSIAWIELLRAHAEKIFSHRQTIFDENQMALQLVKRLYEKYGIGSAFTVRDVGRNGWTGFNNNDFVEKILTVLTDKHWLQAEDSAAKKTIRYKINSKARKHLASI